MIVNFHNNMDRKKFTRQPSFFINEPVNLDSYHLGWPEYWLTIKEDRVLIWLGNEGIPRSIELFFEIKEG